MKNLSLRKNFSWTLAGQIVYAATQWGIITLLARKGSSEMLGEYAIALAIAGPIVTLLNLKLRAVQASDARNEYDFADYFGLRLLTSAASVLIIIIVALMSDRDRDLRLTIAVLALAKSFESISDIFFGLQQQNERMDQVAQSTIIKGLLSFAAFYLGFTVTGRVSGGMIGLAVAGLATLVIIDIPSAYRTLRYIARPVGDMDLHLLRPRFQRSIIKPLLFMTAPLGLTVTLGSLSSNIPRYFIERVLGAGDLGVFAAMVYPLAASSMIISALAQSATPRLSASFQDENHAAFRTLLCRLVAMGAGIGIAGVLAVTILGQQIIDILYGHEYVKYHAIFIWVMVNATIGYLYVFLGTALSAMRRFRVQLPIHLASVTVLTLLCWVFVERWGLSGAMLALTLAALLEAVLYLIVVLAGIRAALTSSSDIQFDDAPSSITETSLNGGFR